MTKQRFFPMPRSDIGSFPETCTLRTCAVVSEILTIIARRHDRSGYFRNECMKMHIKQVFCSIAAKIIEMDLHLRRPLVKLDGFALSCWSGSVLLSSSFRFRRVKSRCVVSGGETPASAALAGANGSRRTGRKKGQHPPALQAIDVVPLVAIVDECPRGATDRRAQTSRISLNRSRVTSLRSATWCGQPRSIWKGDSSPLRRAMPRRWRVILFFFVLYGGGTDRGRRGASIDCIPPAASPRRLHRLLGSRSLSRRSPRRFGGKR
jgi:hypothetical protein